MVYLRRSAVGWSTGSIGSPYSSRRILRSVHRVSHGHRGDSDPKTVLKVTSLHLIRKHGLDLRQLVKAQL